MKRVSEAEAYRAWHREQQRLARRRRDMRRIKLAIEFLELGIQAALAQQHVEEHARLVAEWTPRLATDRAFNKVLGRYWGHTPKGWVAACGCDGRMKKLVRDPGWDVLQEVIRRIRRNKGLIRPPDCRCEARVKPDTTLELKLKLGYGR